MMKQLDDLFVKYRVDFANTSFGSPSTKVLEQMLNKNGCAPAKLGKYVGSSNELSRLGDESHRKRGLLKNKSLTISAFGNDGQSLDSPEDGEGCSKVYTINVGATDLNGKLASFTNRGKCADVYVPGKDVIVATPGDFLLDENGTSFSSPLFIRYLTVTLGKPQASYEDVYKKYKSSGEKIAAKAIPRELLVADSKKFDSFSLRVGDEESPDFVTPLPLLKSNLGGLQIRK